VPRLRCHGFAATTSLPRVRCHGFAATGSLPRLRCHGFAVTGLPRLKNENPSVNRPLPRATGQNHLHAHIYILPSQPALSFATSLGCHGFARHGLPRLKSENPSVNRPLPRATGQNHLHAHIYISPLPTPGLPRLATLAWGYPPAFPLTPPFMEVWLLRVRAPTLLRVSRKVRCAKSPVFTGL
jgi:hypothetical protein